MLNDHFAKASVALLYLWNQEQKAGKTSLSFPEWLKQVESESSSWSNSQEADKIIVHLEKY